MAHSASLLLSLAEITNKAEKSTTTCVQPASMLSEEPIFKNIDPKGPATVVATGLHASSSNKQAAMDTAAIISSLLDMRFQLEKDLQRH